MNPAGRRRITQVGTLAIHWREVGRGRPVVLLHGLSDSHRTWRRTAPMLAATGRRVLLPDLPGHGLSDRPDASYSVDWHAAVVGAWIDEIGLRRFDLVGHSFGGGVAQALLRSHGDRVNHLGLVASGGLGREVTVALRLLSVPGVERALEPCLQLGTDLALRLVGRGFTDDGDRRWHAWANGAPGTGRALARTVRAAVGLRGQLLGLYDRAHEIDALPRTALYWGDRDPVVPVAHAERAAERIPGVTLTRFPGCGHFPHLQAPERFADALAWFLDSAPGRLALTANAAEPARSRLGELGRRALALARALWARVRGADRAAGAGRRPVARLAPRR